LKKKLVGIFLIFCLVAPLAGTYSFLQLRKAAIHREVKAKMIAGLDENDLVLLKITGDEAGDLYWEHSREFEYKGQLYDVVYTEQQGDTTYYRCWADHEETALNHQLRMLVADALGNDPQHKSENKRLEELFKSLFCEDTADRKKLPIAATTASHTFLTLGYTSLFFPPFSPPPQAV
jgi:hypothetical protein